MGRRQRLQRSKREGSSTINVSASTVELMEWFQKHRGGVRGPGPPLRLALFPTTGRGLMALTPLAKDDILISIPLRFMITRDTVEASLGNKTNLSTHHLIAGFLLRELDKGPDSFWDPYLKTLPEQFDVPYFCSQPELESLPRYVKEKCFLQQKIVTSAIKLVTEAGIYNRSNLSRFAWAWFAVNTRAVYFESIDGNIFVDDSENSRDRRSENNLALAPFLDMFNHSSDVTVQVGRADSIDFDEGVYQIRSTNTSYKKYEQVFINYGQHDNLKLCLEYGFVLDHNPNDLVPFELDELTSIFKISNEGKKPDRRISKAFDFIRAQKLDKNLGAIPCSSSSSEAVTWNMVASLFILVNYAKPNSWSRVYSLDVESLLRDPEIRFGLIKIISSKIDEIEVCLESDVANIEKPKITESFEVVQRLLLVHWKILNDSIQCLK